MPLYEDPAEGMLNPEPDEGTWALDNGEQLWAIDQHGSWLPLVMLSAFSGFLMGALVASLVWWLT